jgi:hypothetical protein
MTRMTEDFKPVCRCAGIDGRTPCELPADAEDGLCDRCRENECEEAVMFLLPDHELPIFKGA